MAQPAHTTPTMRNDFKPLPHRPRRLRGRLPGLLVALWALGSGCVQGKYERMDPIDFHQLAAPGAMKALRIGEHKMAVFEAGLGTPVVLLHGLGEHAGYYNDNVPELLRNQLRVVVPDLLGFGRSAKPGGDYKLTDQARHVHGLLSALFIDEPVVLVGHSMGGQIALHFALAWPERVKALVLLAPAGIEVFTPGEGAWLEKVSTVSAFKSRTEEDLRAHYQKNVFGQWVPAAEHHLEERVRLRHAPDFDAYLEAVVASIKAMVREPVADRLPSLNLPVTVVFGDRDGLIPNPILHGDAPERVADQARRRLPRAKVLVLPGLGHMLQCEDPAAINRIILEAVAEVTGPRALPPLTPTAGPAPAPGAGTP